MRELLCMTSGDGGAECWLQPSETEPNWATILETVVDGNAERDDVFVSVLSLEMVQVFLASPPVMDHFG